jgi:hypothetical protein
MKGITTEQEQALRIAQQAQAVFTEYARANRERSLCNTEQEDELKRLIQNTLGYGTIMKDSMSILSVTMLIILVTEGYVPSVPTH